MKNKEQDVQKAIIDFLRLKKYVIFKHHSTGFTVREGKSVAFRYGEKGISDLLACAPGGRFWAIEIKRKGNKPSPEQLDFLARVNAAGGKGILVYSIDEVLAALEGCSSISSPHSLGSPNNAMAVSPKKNPCVSKSKAKTNS